MAKLPPHNQRRLNAAIAAKEPGRTWYDVALDLQMKGSTYQQIAEHFASEYGVKVSIYTVRSWMLTRQSCQTVAA